MNPVHVQKTVATALAGHDALSVAECTQLTLQVHTALTSIGERISRISPAKGREPAGAEYVRALHTGTADDVKKMEEERDSLRILADQLKAQRDELGQRRMDARLREARDGLPHHQAKFVERLDEVEKAHAELKRAVAALMSANGEIYQARTIIRQNHDVPQHGATLKTLRRLDQLFDVFPLEVTRHPNWWLDNIGCAVSESVIRDARAKVQGVDLSDCESDEDVMKVTVEAVAGSSAIDGKSDAEVAAAFAALRFHGREAA